MRHPYPTPARSRHRTRRALDRARRTAAALWAGHRDLLRTHPGYAAAIAALVTALLTAAERGELLDNLIGALLELIATVVLIAWAALHQHPQPSAHPPAN